MKSKSRPVKSCSDQPIGQCSDRPVSPRETGHKGLRAKASERVLRPFGGKVIKKATEKAECFRHPFDGKVSKKATEKVENIIHFLLDSGTSGPSGTNETSADPPNDGPDNQGSDSQVGQIPSWIRHPLGGQVGGAISIPICRVFDRFRHFHDNVSVRTLLAAQVDHMVARFFGIPNDPTDDVTCLAILRRATSYSWKSIKYGTYYFYCLIKFIKSGKFRGKKYPFELSYVIAILLTAYWVYRRKS